MIFKSRKRGWRALRFQIGKKVYEYNTMVRERCILSSKIADEPFIVGEEEFKDLWSECLQPDVACYSQ